MDFSGSLGGTDELWADGGLDGGANRHHSSVHASEEVFVRASRRSVFRASRRSLLVAPMRSLFMPPRRSLFVPPRRSVFRASEEVCVSCLRGGLCSCLRGGLCSCLRGGLCFVPPRRSVLRASKEVFVRASGDACVPLCGTSRVMSALPCHGSGVWFLGRAGRVVLRACVSQRSASIAGRG